MSFFNFFWEKVAGRDPAPDFMYRNTLGTGISDRKVPFSFTLYSFSNYELDSSDLFRLESFFESLLVRWLKRRYPKRDYNMADWEDWGKPIFRVETNEWLDVDVDLLNTYSYEVNQFEEQTGSLEDIL